MAENNDGTTTTTQEPETKPQAGTPTGGEGEGNLIDKHGEQAINKGRYERDMAAKDAEIAALKKQLEESGAKAKSGEDALKKVEELEARLADEELDHALELAGCVNGKAAKALLDDYSGDVAKLKEACPYLFRTHQGGSTGLTPGGAPSNEAAINAKLRAAAGLK